MPIDTFLFAVCALCAVVTACASVLLLREMVLIRHGKSRIKDVWAEYREAQRRSKVRRHRGH